MRLRSRAAAPGLTFRYTRFADVADQIDDARLYGGIHTREDQKVGRELGWQVGVYVWETPLGDTDKARRSSAAL